MANQLPSELTGMTYSGTDLQRSDLSIHFDIVRGLVGGLTVRGEDTVVPGRVGEIPRNRMRGTRELELVGRIMGHGTTHADQLEDAQQSLDILEDLFAPDRSPAALAGTARDGSTRSILARPLAPGVVCGPEDALGTRKVSVVLVSVVPDWTIDGS